MAVTTINELIAQRDEIKNKKKQIYEIETSVGTILAKVPTGGIIANAWDMPNNFEGNKYLVFENVIQPNLRDPELLKAYECFEPIDIVEALFQAGEINKIAGKILEFANYNGKVISKLHKEVKNS